SHTLSNDVLLSPRFIVVILSGIRLCSFGVPGSDRSTIIRHVLLSIRSIAHVHRATELDVLRLVLRVIPAPSKLHLLLLLLVLTENLL
ncbi:hypothetical protein PENTCL1PPCAC_24723, partial [Pristionchus entomophagus]